MISLLVRHRVHILIAVTLGHALELEYSCDTIENLR